MAPQPPEQDDEAIYGLLPHLVACQINYHPALIAGIQKRAEQFGRSFQTSHELRDYTVLVVKRMSAEDVHDMIVANRPARSTPAPR